MIDVLVGQQVLVEAEFRLLGVPTDPTVVRLLIRNPDGGLTVLNFPAETLVRNGTGRYEASVLADASGTWYFRWEGAGVVDAVVELSMAVRPSMVLEPTA